MSTEAKVGGFVLAGLLLLGWGIFLLGDVSLQRHYPIYATFTDIAGLPDKAIVKLSGVEVGNVKSASLREGKVRVEIAVNKGVEIYKDAIFRIGSTSVIGSKYLEIQQGHPSAGVLAEGAEVKAEDSIPLERAVTEALKSVQKLVDEVSSKGGLGRNLNAAVDNLRQTSITMNELLSEIKPSISSAGQRMDQITEKLDSLLAKADQAMANVQKMTVDGKDVMSKVNSSTAGTVGALLGDQDMKDDIKQTVRDVKATAGSLKDVLGKVTAFRVFWSYNNRYDFDAQNSRGDVGVRISPREGRYYHLGMANLGSTSEIPRTSKDYEHKNNIEAQLGWNGPAYDLHIGLIKGAGGMGFELAPFSMEGLKEKLWFFADMYDFSRNSINNGRFFTKPQLDAGARYQVHRIVSLGARVQDILERPRLQTDTRILFEDKDIAYLFGLISFGAAGTKGRSSN